jgi:Fe-Mn family superoxide dismutase
MLTTRRQALKTLTAAAVGSTALGRLPTYAQTPAHAPAPSTGPYVLPAWPYAYDALEPQSIRIAVRNQGGGHANHSLFWKTLSPASKDSVRMISDGAFSKALTDDVGGKDKLKEEMSKQGGTLFGSGWVWLVLDGGRKLTILTLPNQDSPLMEGHYPLFGIDVWEHAYYLKYHNVRADYLAAIWNVVNWDFVSDRYSAAMKA